MISEDDKIQALGLISEACKAGARKGKAACLLGLPIRTVQRWEEHGLSDNRKGSRAVPANKISEDEKEKIVAVLKSPEFGDSNPNQIVPKLADQGIYMGSESTMYRILRDLELNNHRQSSQPVTRIRPEPYIATGPNKVWTWDITYLPTALKGSFFYLYMVMDVYSRKAVAYQVYDRESGDLAADLITDACAREGVARNQLVLHSDNGASMKSVTMLTKLQQLGVMPSFSRPSVSNDNPYSESLFRTLKYRPEYPEQPFETINNARDWSDRFAHWYNDEHLHSGICFVTPEDRHQGKDVEILAQRHQVYIEAKAKNPERWSGSTRNWSHISEVALNKGKPTKPTRTEALVVT